MMLMLALSLANAMLLALLLFQICTFLPSFRGAAVVHIDGTAPDRR